jgi:hypothetical protein
MRSNTVAVITSEVMDKKEYHRAYYLAHREKIINRQREYSVKPETKERRRIYNSKIEYTEKELKARKAYNVAHRAEINEYKKLWNKNKRKTSPEIKLKMYEAAKKWRQKNRKYLTQYDKEWRIKHPEKWKLFHAYSTAVRRSRIKSATIAPFSYKEILQRDGYKCHLCGRVVTKKELSFDHLIPIARGGSHSRENVAVAHLACNIKRNAGRIPAQLRLL